MPNLDCAMGHKIKTGNHPRHETPCVIRTQQTETQYNLFKKLQITVFGPLLYNSMPKYLRDIGSVKTEKLKFELVNFPELIPD